jgi:hypothetical protein
MRTLALSAVQAAAGLTFDQKLALSLLEMDGRLGSAGLGLDVRTAHIEIPEILAAPLSVAHAAAPTTVADVLAKAAQLIAAHGWIRRYVGSAQTGYCLIGAIRAAAGGNRKLEDAAEADVLDRIRAQFPDAISIGSWNDSQSGPGPVLRMLG